MEKIIITGSDGFFASRFIDTYKDKYNIIALNHSDLNIVDYEKTLGLIESIMPKYLIHTAAISDISICEKDPQLSYDVNVSGTLNLAKACRRMNVKMIYFSSDQVYSGNQTTGPYDEAILPVPNNVYGKHKLEAEMELQKILNDSVILRISWLFTLPERGKKFKSNIIWNVIKAALNNNPLKLSNNEYRGMSYVYDLIDIFNDILQLPGGIYNASSENNLCTYDIGKHILKELGLENRINELLIKDVDSYKEKPRDLRMCNEKLRNFDIYINDTENAISKCIKDFKFHYW